MSILSEFKSFINRGSVVDLAVGVIIGAAFTTIVNSLVNDIVMPPIGWLLGGLDFSSYYINLSSVPYSSLAEAQKAGAATINYGLFLNTLIKFLLISWVLFIIIKQMNRWNKKPDPAPAAKPADVLLLEEIRDLLKK